VLFLIDFVLTFIGLNYFGMIELNPFLNWLLVFGSIGYATRFIGWFLLMIIADNSYGKFPKPTQTFYLFTFYVIIPILFIIAIKNSFIFLK